VVADNHRVLKVVAFLRAASGGADLYREIGGC